MGIDELLFGGSMGWNAGQPRGWRDGTCSNCMTPIACQSVGICRSGLQMRERYDVDLPADAVREVQPTRALPAPLIEGDSDGGECD
ncbi:hypothetical protein ACTJLD_30370 [Burkholderia sp. 22088]|uniref:hypothetical protein n=1 Tax=Burkholderia sp. 22088 TaxID=3453871 RepID=UPI003F853BA2